MSWGDKTGGGPEGGPSKAGNDPAYISEPRSTGDGGPEVGYLLALTLRQTRDQFQRYVCSLV